MNPSVLEVLDTGLSVVIGIQVILTLVAYYLRTHHKNRSARIVFWITMAVPVERWLNDYNAHPWKKTAVYCLLLGIPGFLGMYTLVAVIAIRGTLWLFLAPGFAESLYYYRRQHPTGRFLTTVRGAHDEVR